MDKLILSSGEMISCLYCSIAFDGTLVFVTKNSDYVSHAVLFGDPEKTKKITHYPLGNKNDAVVYNGYTTLISLERDAANGGIIVALRKE